MSMSSVEGTTAGGFDPPLVRGYDGKYYFALRGRDPYGGTGTLYVPADVRGRELSYFDERGKHHWMRIGRDDLADPREVEGRFVKFKPFKHALTFEARYRGRTIYVPVPGGWYQDPEDHYGRWVFAIRAAEDEPDDRYMKNYKLDLFLSGQTYRYKTHKEMTGRAGEGVLAALAGLAFIFGWIATIITIGTIMFYPNNYMIYFGNSVGNLAPLLIISIATIGATVWLAYVWHQGKSPYHLDRVPDVRSLWESAARRGGKGAPPRREDEPPNYLG
ncbi:MAG: hypothetical protein RXS42_07680 [Nitrososphaeria archaeon]